MYAIIATGGKQYKVAEGDVIRVEKLGVEAGETVTFDNVIAVSNDGLKVGEDVKEMCIRDRIGTDNCQKSCPAARRRHHFRKSAISENSIYHHIKENGLLKIRAIFSGKKFVRFIQEF